MTCMGWTFAAGNQHPNRLNNGLEIAEQLGLIEATGRALGGEPVLVRATCAPRRSTYSKKPVSWSSIGPR